MKRTSSNDVVGGTEQTFVELQRQRCCFFIGNILVLSLNGGDMSRVQMDQTSRWDLRIIKLRFCIGLYL